MPRRGIAIAVVVIFASLIVLGLTSSFLVDWAWFSAVGYLGVFWTILGGKAVLFFAVFAGSATLLWLNGYLAHRFARRQAHVRRVDFEQIAAGVQTLPELLGLMGQRLPWRLLIENRLVTDADHDQHSETRRPRDHDRSATTGQPVPVRRSRIRLQGRSPRARVGVVYGFPTFSADIKSLW